MSENKKVKAIPEDTPFLEVKFNLETQEAFAKSRGVTFVHWAAMPSPIGLKDRGDYRRPDSLDTIAENGFIYKKIGEFVGTIVGNSKSHQIGGAAEGGIYDNSTARIVIPKTYDKACTKKTDISLLPGDRIYAKDIILKVDNYQRASYNPKGSDYLQFPAICVDFLEDSNGNEYEQNKHFNIDKNGNINWIIGKNNPGIDPETGKGRVYSIRYTYNAYWYIQHLINEIRTTNTNTADEPARLPYHAVIQREYVYHSKVRGDAQNSNTETFTERTAPEPTEKLDDNSPQVRVDIRNFSDD